MRTWGPILSTYQNARDGCDPSLWFEEAQKQDSLSSLASQARLAIDKNQFQWKILSQKTKWRTTAKNINLYSPSYRCAHLHTFGHMNTPQEQHIISNNSNTTYLGGVRYLQHSWKLISKYTHIYVCTHLQLLPRSGEETVRPWVLDPSWGSDVPKGAEFYRQQAKTSVSAWAQCRRA